MEPERPKSDCQGPLTMCQLDPEPWSAELMRFLLASHCHVNTWPDHLVKSWCFNSRVTWELTEAWMELEACGLMVAVLGCRLHGNAELSCQLFWVPVSTSACPRHPYPDACMRFFPRVQGLCLSLQSLSPSPLPFASRMCDGEGVC